MSRTVTSFVRPGPWGIGETVAALRSLEAHVALLGGYLLALGFGLAEEPDLNGLTWRPMVTVKDVRDGRPILLRFDDEPPIDGALVIFGAVIGHWSDREWYVSTNARDLTCGSGRGLLDEDFTGWAPLPDISSAEIARLSKAA
jgi:hypothetical protein